jgi:mono/diheme cytochrome c family protein
MGLVRNKNVKWWGGMALSLAALAAIASCAGSGGTDHPVSSSAGSSGPSAAESAGAKAQNPIPRDDHSVTLGRAIYAKQCQSCHGPRGRGDGPAAGRLNVDVPNLTAQDVQSESDGELFNIITKGSKPMPAYRRLLNEEQRWHVVNYLRASFGPQAGSS